MKTENETSAENSDPAIKVTSNQVLYYSPAQTTGESINSIQTEMNHYNSTKYMHTTFTPHHSGF